MIGPGAMMIYVAVMVFVLAVVSFYFLFCPEKNTENQREYPLIKDKKQSSGNEMISIDPESVDFENKICKGVDGDSLYYYDELCWYLRTKVPHIRIHYGRDGTAKKILHLAPLSRARTGL